MLCHLLRDQADELQRIVRTATDRVDSLEDAVLLGRGNRATQTRSELSQLRRMAVRLQRMLAPEPAAFWRMLAQPPAWVAVADENNRSLFVLTMVTVLALPINLAAGLQGPRR